MPGFSFTLASVASGTGVYTGTFPGGASNGYAGQVVNIVGFTNAANNVNQAVITASTATTITTGNTNSVSETHAATATDVTQVFALYPGGHPGLTVVASATATGSGFSTLFNVPQQPSGGPRQLWLALGPTSGTITAFTVELDVSTDGGLHWEALQTSINLFGAPAQMVSPTPPPGAICRISVDSITGSGSPIASVIASCS